MATLLKKHKDSDVSIKGAKPVLFSKLSKVELEKLSKTKGYEHFFETVKAKK